MFMEFFISTKIIQPLEQAGVKPTLQKQLEFATAKLSEKPADIDWRMAVEILNNELSNRD